MTPHSHSQKGFSLVEVTLALGVVAFSLVSILGVLPVGLTNLRTAIDTSVETQIFNQVASEVALMSYTEIDDYVQTSPLYYDDNGRRVDSGAAASYRADLTLATPNYPGMPTGIDANLTNLQVRVYNKNRGHETSTRHRHNLLISRTDKPL